MALLDARIAGVAARVGEAAALPAKEREDLLDAVICCAVGIDVLAGRAVAYGDADAATWIPREDRDAA